MDFINHHSAVTAAVVKMNKTGRCPVVLDTSDTTVSGVPYGGGAGQSFRLVPQADGSTGIRSRYFWTGS